MPEYELTRDSMIGRAGMKKGSRITLTEMQAKPFGDALVRVVAVTAPDNLTIIKGISEKRQTLLNDLGIFTYASLIAADPVELAMKIPSTTADGVRKWQAQAKDL